MFLCFEINVFSLFDGYSEYAFKLRFVRTALFVIWPFFLFIMQQLLV